MLLLFTLMGCPVDSDSERPRTAPPEETASESGALDSVAEGETGADSDEDSVADSMPDTSGETGETGETAAPPGPAGVEVEFDATCTGGGHWFSEWQEMASDDLNMRIISVYGSTDDGPVTVRVEDPRPLVLVLVGYEVTKWVIEEEVPGTVERIYVSGYYTPEVDAPSGAEVEGVYSLGDLYVRQDRLGEAEAAASMKMSSFHGCYQASEFTIRAAPEPLDTSGRPECDAPETWGAWEEPDLDYVSGVCPDTTSESAYCVAILDHDIVTIGLDSGDTCTLVSGYTTGDIEEGTEEVALLGDDVYTCASARGNLVKVSLVDGAQEHARSWCKGLKGWANGGALLSHVSARWTNYEVYSSGSWEQSWCAASESTGLVVKPWRIATREDELYAGAITTGDVARTDLITGEDNGDLTLDGVSTFTADMSFIQDGAVLVTLDVYGQITLNDANTGESLGTVTVDGGSLRGIDCFDGD